MKRLILCGTATLLLVLAGCGLDTVPFISPPVGAGSIGTGVQFRHNNDNNGPPQSESFLGYEVYYKFYDFSPGANGLSLLEDDREAIEADPVPPGPARLTGRNYRRLRTTTDGTTARTQLPLVTVAVGSSMTIQLCFSGSPGTCVTGDDGGAYLLRNNNESGAQRLVRAVDAADGTPRPFYPIGEYDRNHTDIPNTINLPTDAPDLRVAFYALAFGVQSDFRPLYSTPVFLSTERELDFQ